MIATREAKSPNDREVARTPSPATRVPRSVNWSDPTRRHEHIATFCAWLPEPLLEAPHIAWDKIPSRTMGYLVRTVGASPDALPIAFAVGAIMSGTREETLRCQCESLTRLFRRLRTHYGMQTLADLHERAVWDAYIANRHLSGGEMNTLTTYDSISRSRLPLYLQQLEPALRRKWGIYAIPPLPIHFIKRSGQRTASRAAAEERRKGQSDVLVPLLPLLVEIVQFRKQSMERLCHAVRQQIARVTTGEAMLPVPFTFHERLRSVNAEARTLGEVHLIERDVDLSFTLWDKPSWVKAHPERYGQKTRYAAQQQRRTHHSEAYDPARNAYFVQHHGSPADLLWFGDLLATQVMGRVRSTASAARQAAAEDEERGGFFTHRPGLLIPLRVHANWLAAAVAPGEQLFEPEALYRGVLFGAALATLSMTSAARVNELLQVSAIRWRRLDIPQGQHSGRTTSKAVQMLLPKGKTQERDRQVFLISDATFRLLMEIQQLLIATHATPDESDAHGTLIPNARTAIPWVEPHESRKAEDLGREPYLFQWAAHETGRLGLLQTHDVTKLLRFMLHGLQFTTREGMPIHFATHLIRHVVATYARHEALIPPEAIAVMLHHELSSPAAQSFPIPTATAYYSKMPLEDALAGILAFQAQLVREQASAVLCVPTLADLGAMELTVRQIFETWGSIGPTPFGWCGAGKCVRPKGRGNCIDCEWVLPDFRQSSNIRRWRVIYQQSLQQAEHQGLVVQAREARQILDWLDGLENVMRLQLQAHLDGEYIPTTDMVLTAECEAKTSDEA